MNIQQVDNFYKSLLKEVNTCGLEISSAYFVLKSVLLLVEQLYQQSLLTYLGEKTEEHIIDLAAAKNDLLDGESLLEIIIDE